MMQLNNLYFNYLFVTLSHLEHAFFIMFGADRRGKLLRMMVLLLLGCNASMCGRWIFCK